MTGPAVLHLRQSAGGGGGADSVLAQILRQAKDSGRPRLLCAYLRKPADDVGALVAPLAAVGIAVEEVPGRSLVDPRQLDALEALIRREDVRVLHSHDPKSDVLAWLLRRRMPGLRLVATLHGWTGKSWKGRLYARLDRWVLRSFDRVLAVSGALARQAAEGGLPGCLVSPNGVDTAFWNGPERPPRQPGEVFTLGFVGRLSVEKNPALFVEVAAALPDRASLRILVAGEGPEREAAEGLARRHGMEDRVAFLGRLAPDRLRTFYGELDALLLTSRTEGLPMALLEAGAMRVPVIAARVGGVGEVVVEGETGLIIDGPDVAAFAAAAGRLRDDPQAARTLGRRARDRVEREFDQRLGWRRLAGLYADLLEGER